MITIRTQARLALIYFLIAALWGVTLRFFAVFDIPANYRFLVNTHSHIALLGWIYLAITTFLYKLYLNEPHLDSKYSRLFWFTWATLAGMLFTFPFVGYALLSIFCTTAFLLASYWFAWFFFKQAPANLKSGHAFQFIKAALWFMVISSLGPWALGIIMNTSGSESVWYRLSIYFYLHFQYNGWMTMVLIGLLFFMLQKTQLTVSALQVKYIFWLLTLGIVLSFFLSTLWTEPGVLFYVLGGAGALSQLLALIMILLACRSSKTELTAELSRKQWSMLLLVTVLITVKLLLQLITTLPYFAELAASVLDFTIGYLHWTFLGVVTIAIFMFLDYFKIYPIPKAGYVPYLLGFFISEALIFYKGISTWQQWSLFNGYFEMLTAASLLIPLGLTIMLMINKK